MSAKKMKTEKGASSSRILSGVVVSDKMRKTVVVSVSRFVKHPKYGKYYKVDKRYKAHDEKGAYKTGDRVLIAPTRPISKDKHYKVLAQKP